MQSSCFRVAKISFYILTSLFTYQHFKIAFSQSVNSFPTVGQHHMWQGQKMAESAVEKNESPNKLGTHNEQRGMGSTNHPTNFGGMHAAASGSSSLLGISSLAPNNSSAHWSMNNQAYSNTFPSTSSSSSYYWAPAHMTLLPMIMDNLLNPMNLPLHMFLNWHVLHTQVIPCLVKVQKTGVNIQACWCQARW